MRVVDLIRKKRDGAELSGDEIRAVVTGYTSGDIPDYQMSAWLMAVWIKGMKGPELAALTEAMLNSGKVLDFSDLPASKVDKHSTGGVGDKTSLILAPIVAACGLYVPMISGRGLGHTGGTLDKLESIPGFSVNLSLDKFRKVLEKCGCGLIGQTAEIAPADKKIYALRDVTGTVESPNLICASIMSKKLAEGIDALVLDVKTGSGAFMKKEEDAVYLASLMVETGQRMGKKMVALITNMDQPLGRYVGNALEVEECIQILSGEGAEDLREISLDLSAWMLFLGGHSKTVEDGKRAALQVLQNGRAKERFQQIIELQGGNPRVVDDPNLLPKAKHEVALASPIAGYLTATECERIGVASLILGGGREKKEDEIDHSVGLIVHKRIGDSIAAGETLCTVYYNSNKRLDEALNLLRESFKIETAPPASRPKLIHQILQRAS